MKKVLVVDDEEGMCMLIAHQLRRNGHTVKTVSSGNQAAEILGQESFDIVVTDFALGSMNGRDVAHVTKEISRGQTYVILMSGVVREIGEADLFLLKDQNVLEQLPLIIDGR